MRHSASVNSQISDDRACVPITMVSPKLQSFKDLIISQCYAINFFIKLKHAKRASLHIAVFECILCVIPVCIA